MKRIGRIILTTLILLSVKLIGQPAAAPSCPTQSIYAHNGSLIYGHTLPNGPANTVLNNLPGGASGLAIGPSFAFPAPNPTWWTTAGSPRTYWYYNNAGTWTNTGHLCINTAAVNLGGGGTCLYNLVGASGNIYKYTGTGNDFLLTTLVPAFSGQGPYDVVCDLADNFYILKASPAAQQGIYCYNPQGVLTCSWSITGMINQTAGGGFAILNTNNPSVHKMYYNSNGTDYIGNMLPNNTTIVSTVQALPSGGDYASCALNIPQGLITAPLGGTLTCNLTQIPLVAQVLGNSSLNWIGGYNTPTTTPITPTCGTIQWSGPGIVSGQGTTTINVNTPGVYTYTLNGCNTCPNYSITASYTVVGQTGILTPSITAPTCYTGQTTMSVSPNTNTNTVLWSGPGIVGPNNTFTITFNAPGVYTAAVSSGTACTGTATVLVNPSPTLNIVASTNSVCEQNFNGSPTTVTFTGSGASSYTWSGSGLSTTQTNTDNPITFTSNVGSSVGSVTLVGSNGTCSNSTTYSINIIPNPTISVTSGSICMGNSITLTANNASTYTWTPNTNLNTNNGPSVIANPSVTTVYSIIGTSLGCNSQAQTSTVTVVPNPIININPIQPVICLGGSINLTANGATSFTWSPNINLNTNVGPSVIANPTVNTTYTVLGSQNTCTNIGVITVSVLGLPNITITPSSPTLCMNNFNGSPNTVTLNASGATTYTWGPITGLNTNTLNGSSIVGTANGSSVGTGTVIGANGSCTNIATFTVNVVNNPTITATSGSMCVGTNVTLTSSGASTYTWSPPTNLNTINGPVVIANPSVTTVYSIIGSSVGCNSQTQNATASVVPNPTITINPNQPVICLGGSINLTANGATNYSWTPSTTLNNTNTPNVVANPTVNTTYTVLGSQNTCTNTAVVTVTVLGLPSITVTPSSSTLCMNNFNGSPNTVTLTANGATSYTWGPIVGLTTNTLNGSSIIGTANGSPIGTGTVIGANGNCTNTATFTVNVINNPIIAVSSGSMCIGTNVNLTANGATSYTWSPSNTLNTPFGSNVTANPSVTTVYSVIGSSVGCNSQAQTGTVNVVNNPTITITPTNPVICFGGNINLTANGATNYTWTPNVALSNTLGANVNSNPSTTQTYSVIGEASTCTNVASITVTVLPLPVMNVIASSPTVCMNNFNGSPNMLTLTGTGATNYTWTSITGLTTNTTNGSVIIVTPNTSNIGTGVLIGATGSCTNSTTFSVGIIPNPTISIVSGSMCIGTNVNLTASGSTNYTWSPSNTLNTAFGNIVIANPSVTTVYSIIGNSLGCNSQTQTGTVTVVPLPIISVGPITNTICQGSNLTLNASGATNYTWVPNNYLNTNVGSSVISNPPSTTNYTVIGESNTCTNTAVYQVSVIPVPSILLSASSTTVCENTLVNLTANGANSYYWTPNNVSGSSISQLMTGTTTYSVVGSNGQCIGSGTITISVIPLPNLGVSTLPNTVCSGNSATMTAFGASNYIWTPSSSLSSNNSPVVVATPSVSTNYIITGYNSMDTVVCASTKEVFITVLPNTNPIVSPSVSLCQGAKATIGVTGGTEYLWVPGNYTTSYIVVSPTITTKYDVVVTNQGYCGKTASVLVEVHQQPFVNAGRDTTFNLDEPMHLNATGTGTLTWIFGEGIYCKDCPNTQIFPTKDGCYTIQAVNKYNCTAIDEVCVKVTTDYSIYIPNTFTPNGDGNNDTFRVHGVGIKDVSLTVFDRWGEELFHSDDVMVGWDGYYKFELCKNDVYVYLVKYTSLDGKKHTKTGHVTLMK